LWFCLVANLGFFSFNFSSVFRVWVFLFMLG
jgi:hypothetical protein